MSNKKLENNGQRARGVQVSPERKRGCRSDVSEKKNKKGERKGKEKKRTEDFGAISFWTS